MHPSFSLTTMGRKREQACAPESLQLQGGKQPPHPKSHSSRKRGSHAAGADSSLPGDHVASSSPNIPNPLQGQVLGQYHSASSAPTTGIVGVGCGWARLAVWGTGTFPQANREVT